jgi:hypothetical protein
VCVGSRLNLKLSRTFASVMILLFDDLFFYEMRDSSENPEKCPATPQVAETPKISLETPENVPLHSCLIF